jgi:hypothetical protein
VKVPDPEAEYYHGCVQTDQGRAWFQQSRRGRRVLQFGPLELGPGEGRLKRGDIILGRLECEPRGSKMVGWYPGASPLKHFYDVCVNGTRKCESQLLETMGMPGDDRVWALCRLLMFGNVGVFSREHTRPTMKLKMDVVAFVHKASTTLHDHSIWDEFVKLVPDATPPQPPLPDPEPEFVKRLHTATPDHAWGAVPLPPPNVEPMSVEPYSPTYNPTSPPYNPTSPPYNPTSPPYNPTSPPYNPTSPPASPPYNPTSPPTSPTLSVQPHAPQLDIATLSSLISQYCPPPVQAYDPYNPAYDSTT